jgi:sulfate permease, SulP family
MRRPGAKLQRKPVILARQGRHSQRRIVIDPANQPSRTTLFHALRSSFAEHRTLGDLRADLLAGLTVGIVALPLSMALAIAVGLPPQHGLYTAIVAGAVIALTGGSAVNISGPTAAFVVVLLPIVQAHGLGGLLIAGLLAGFLLVGMGIGRLGALIELVPYPVTVGFTAGIGVVIAALQIKDLLGLDLALADGHFTDRLAATLGALPTLRWQEALIGGATLAVLILWPRIDKRVPAHLVAVVVGSVLAWTAGHLLEGFSVATIGSRFHYDIGGLTGSGIPPLLPAFAWPWEQPGPDGRPVGLSFELIRGLFGSALAIAVLGALESLLCAVVADGMSGRRHDPNDELIGQGIGNILAPLFGGIPATAAIARTATNVRAGARSPLAGVVHALFLLAAVLVLAPWLAYVPMATMAALLVIVAWHMSDADHFVRTLRIAPNADRATLLACFTLTVLFDMVIAVGVGMALASVLFIRASIALTDVKLIDDTRPEHAHQAALPPGVVVYDINGPLFFGSAQRALKSIAVVNPDIRVVVLDMGDVTMLDMTGIVAMESIVKDLAGRGVALVVANLAPRMLLKLRRAGVRPKQGSVELARNLSEALDIAGRMAGAPAARGDGTAT